MTELEEATVPLAITPRQRRLRVWTAVVLATIVVMIVIGVTSPFFKPSQPAVWTARTYKALQVKALFIGLYWIICTLMATSLFLLAWLDVREVARAATAARRDYWREIADRTRERRAMEGRDEQRSG